MKKIILSLFLVMILSFTPVYESYADAGTITIAGGSIGVAGLGAAGLAGLTGPVVVAVFCGLMAVGLDIELTKQSQAEGMTKTEFIKTKIQQYCNEANITLGVFNDAILSGMSVLNDGRISLTDRACKQIKQFGNWLFENDMVETPSSSQDTSLVNLLGLDMPVLNQGQSLEVGKNNNSPVSVEYVSGQGNMALCYYSSGSSYGLAFISNVAGQRRLKFYGYDWTKDFTKYGSYYLYTFSLSLKELQIPIFQGTYQQLLQALREADGSWDVTQSGASEDTFTGSRDDWASGSNVLDSTADKTTVINPNITIPTTADKDLTIDVNSYLEALQKVLDRLQDITIPAVDDATGVPVDITIELPQVIDPDITKEDDTDLPEPDDRTPVINDDDTPVGPVAVEPLKFDLRNIFPFCIPFDVRDMISMLSAEPEAPRYHVSWEIPWINENLEFTVDLSAFDNVAAICRKMELLLFVVGLAVVTRSMFIRS